MRDSDRIPEIRRCNGILGNRFFADFEVTSKGHVKAAWTDE